MRKVGYYQEFETVKLKTQHAFRFESSCLAQHFVTMSHQAGQKGHLTRKP